MAVTQMTKGSISKQLILFSIPILISNLFQQLYNIMISRSRFNRNKWVV